ncbi:MAG: fumarate hydratase [Desulfovibrionaceae bacterium]|nr:fumarate hydratase [Desulfovibrionaceae bacterium]
MREIHVSDISAAVADLVRQACCRLPGDVVEAMRRAEETEKSALGREILGQFVLNASIAAEESIPVCQDTGLMVVFADLGQDAHITGGSLQEAVDAGVAKGTLEGYLRRSSVAEPLFNRKNTGDNTPAIVHLRLVPGDGLRLRVAPKGAGSENKSVVRMLVPADGLAGVKKVVMDAVRAAGPNSCPPMVVGVGVGGNLEVCAMLAKRACARDLGTRNPHPDYAALELELLDKINRTGIGPQGLGGSTTAFDVHIEWAPTHIAMLPVAVNINCNATRHAEAVL